MGSDRVESQIAGFIAKYAPAIQDRLRDARSRLRALFPRGHELVFDNYNALVFGISATDRTADSFVSIAGYPKWVTLFFLRGVDLDDPTGLLVGDGKQVRSIRLKNAEDLDRPDVLSLISQAAVPHAAAFEKAPPLTTIVRMVVDKQRPRHTSA